MVVHVGRIRDSVLYRMQSMMVVAAMFSGLYRLIAFS
jgi:hypothetical protein